MTRRTSGAAARAREARDARRRHQPGARVPVVGGDAAVHARAARARAIFDEDGKPLRRPRRLVRPADPRARAPGRGRGRRARRARAARRSARRRAARSSSPRRIARCDALGRAACASSRPAPRRRMSALRLARGGDRPRAHREVRRLLPRPRRLVPRQGGLGRADARARPDSPGVPAASRADTLVRRYNDLARSRPLFARARRATSPRSSSSRSRRTSGCVAPGARLPRRAARALRRDTARCSSSTR